MNPGEGPILCRDFGRSDLHTLAGYRAAGGYCALEKAVAMDPGEIIDLVKASGLRGRGGAGFPTGLKWSFVPKDSPKARYLVTNADEGEPGTFKDRLLLDRNPHALIEGMVIACLAFGGKVAYAYLRGEFGHEYRRLETALAAATEAGVVG